MVTEVLAARLVQKAPQLEQIAAAETKAWQATEAAAEASVPATAVLAPGTVLETVPPGSLLGLGDEASLWGIDEAAKLQYIKINRYMTPMKIPLQAHPSKGQGSPTTISFHYPLSDYSKWLYEAGFVIDLIEEWISDKVSTGKTARMENRSREEFPLFLAIRAIKT